MQISVNLRQQIAKMCCKSSSMWKCSTSSSGQQLHQQYKQLQLQHLKQQHEPVTTTQQHQNQSHGHTQSHRFKYISSRRQHSLAAICSIACFLLIALIQMQSVTGLKEGLAGNMESCANEGEEILINRIQNSKCFKCTCLNGFVQCDYFCPSIDGCYLLEAKSNDSCCRKCKGCIFRGVPYASGAEWSDPDEPCKTYKCIANVVTETTQKCYSQCDDSQLTPPRPGECCPTCQGCKINGQIVAEGQEAVASIDDRCLVCKCSGNKLSCAKKTCPILQCPISKQIHPPNECCPRCSGQREIMTATGKCLFNTKVYYDRTQFTPDRCTNCTCLNGTSVCQRATCPILECAPEFQEEDGCCPRCAVAEMRSECSHQGITYLNNETWNMGPCRSCRCNGGTISCSEMRCQAVHCRPNEELKVPPGECCPKCMEIAGTCTVFGDPHFKTFDGKFFSFQGSCKYLLAADCRGHNFSIRLTNDGRGTRRSSWPKTVTLKLRGLRINLGQKLRVKINGTRVALPYFDYNSNGHGHNVSITRLLEGGIMLHTELGLTIEWDGNNFLQVSVPAQYKHHLCGLCGNYNGSGRDDLTGRDGRSHDDTEVGHFANSWKVGGPKSCSRARENVVAQPTCHKHKTDFYCQPLYKSDVFGNCDNSVNPNNYIASCSMDVCECPTGTCHCDSFAAYAHECRRLGVKLPDWRAATNCPAGSWRRNATIATFAGNSNYGDPSFVRFMKGGGGGAGGARARRRKQKQKQKQLQLQRHQQNELQENEYIKKHVPNKFRTRAPDRTPPPIH
ncbi:BMP-binding endothelial regulator protein isoform X1 [Drosophila sulfurigaster albostrigata]|uniref:BMP-binding endothelial regulator protein isoform X1 n=1 Tax=Drosophila sulfurigaster albostrigata TaxID=89887 RepID=UPI002D21A8D1|nr:BMP-binding endothelial regulator protein isoform X1 [Drosophila sulfurigaster albostrigata]XP_062130762.1 BMP-binding endothelial regulator protein isoform X1 [Drosophila sulfurigaster albostrigata]